MWAVISKELQVIVRDRLGFIMLFVAPVMFITIMSLALGQAFNGLGDQSDHSYSFAVVDHDKSEQSQAVIDTLKNEAAFEVITDYSQKKANEEVVKGNIGIAVIISKGFGEGAVNNGDAGVTIKLDPAQSNQIVVPTSDAVKQVTALTITTSRAVALFTSAAETTQDPNTAKALADAATAMGEIKHEVTIENAEGLEDVVYPTVYQQNVPGYTIMFVFFIVTTLAGAIMLERRQGTFRRLISSPLPRWKLLLGKVLPYTIISLIQIVLLISFGHFVFDMDLGLHPLAMVPVSICLAICATSLGVLLSAFAKTEAQTQGLGLIIILILAAFGGCMVPLVFMPKWMAQAAVFTPHGIALQSFQDILVRGKDLVDVLPNCGWLLAFSALFLVFGLPRFMTLPNR